MAAAEDYDLWLRILAKHEIGLIAEPLVMRRAGHPGQLSATVPAIDRFRLLALLKLLDGDQLNLSQRCAVGIVIEEKCAIYAQGLRRRGREADAIAVMEIRRAHDVRGRGTRAHIAVRFDRIDGDDYRQRCIRNRSSAWAEANDRFSKVAENVA